MLHPRWTRISLGHLVRRTVPLRDHLSRIALSGLFVPHPDDLTGLRAAWRTRFAQIEYESTTGTGGRAAQEMRPLLRLFNDSDYSFEKLNPWHDRLVQDLELSIAPRWRRLVNSYAPPLIGLNIRRGKDFSPPPSIDQEHPYDWIAWLQQTPLNWFIETLEMIREKAGWKIPGVIVSDGSDESLKPLLQLPFVERFQPSNPVTDLLVLSRTRLLLGSTSSTFSAWAAFIGQQTTITAPGPPFSRFALKPLRGQIITAFNPRRPDPTALLGMVEIVNQMPASQPL